MNFYFITVQNLPSGSDLFIYHFIIPIQIHVVRLVCWISHDALLEVQTQTERVVHRQYKSFLVHHELE